MKKMILTALLSCFASFAFAANADSGLASNQITVKTPKVEIYTKNTNSAEIYMELDNASKISYALIAANSPMAEQVQLHKTINEGHGQSMMRPVTKIEIPAKKDADLKPGGFHVMLIDLKQPLKIGTDVPFTLIFSDGSYLKLDAKVVG